MDAQPTAHPAADHLKAFGLGESLDPSAAETIEQHLETCAECRRAAAELSADPFLDRLRAARNADGTPAPERPVDGLARSIHPPTAAVPPAPSGDPLPPELAAHPDYEVERELGRGGMGVVYLAHNRLMDRTEVLKVMSADVVNKPGAADRFLRELRSAARLAHPNVVRAYSASRLGDTLMFAMEYVEGDDLAGLVEARGPLPVLHACYYVQQAAAGLQHAHEMGMVHRDIKPANLILARAGKKHTVKILDFGLAKVRGEDTGGVELTAHGAMMGTPSYMAPEQWQDAANADIRADIYGLGCTLYSLLTGNSPFAGGVHQLCWLHQNAEPEPLTRVRPEVPAELAVVAARMMAKDPAARFQTPVEVMKALAPFVKLGAAKPVPANTAPVEADDTPARPVRNPDASRTNPDGPPAWETLANVSLVPVVAPGPTPLPGRKRPWLWPAVAGGVALVVLLAAGAGGAFRLKTRDGTIVLENLPADADVSVDGQTVTVTRNGEQGTVALNRGGPHRLKVVQGGKEVHSSDLTVNIGGEPVRVRVEPAAVARIPPADATPPNAGPGPARPAAGAGPAPPVDRSAVSRGSVTWSKVGDVLVGESASAGLVFGDPAWTDYVFSADVRVVSGPPEVTLSARTSLAAPRTGYDFKVGTVFRNADLWVAGRGDGKPVVSVPKTLGFDAWNRVQLSVVGNRIRGYAAPAGGPLGAPVVELTDDRARTGRVAIGIGYPQQQGKAVIEFKNLRVTDPAGNVLWEGFPDLPPGGPEPPKKTAAEVEKEGIAKLQRVLLDHKWYYLDNLFPPGAPEQFFPNGTFSNWRWKYWVVGPRTMRVHYDRNQTNKDTGILFTFNEELTKFTAQFTDPNGRVHKITGARR